MEIFLLSALVTALALGAFTVWWLLSGQWYWSEILVFLFSFLRIRTHSPSPVQCYGPECSRKKWWVIILPLGMHRLVGQDRKVCIGNISAVFAWWMERVLSFLGMFMRGEKKQWNLWHYNVKSSASVLHMPRWLCGFI